MMIFYRPEQVAPNLGTISPSAFKPQQVMDDWQRMGVLTADNVSSFEPVNPCRPSNCTAERSSSSTSSENRFFNCSSTRSVKVVSLVLHPECIVTQVCLASGLAITSKIAR